MICNSLPQFTQSKLHILSKGGNGTVRHFFSPPCAWYGMFSLLRQAVSIVPAVGATLILSTVLSKYRSASTMTSVPTAEADQRWQVMHFWCDINLVIIPHFSNQNQNVFEDWHSQLYDPNEYKTSIDLSLKWEKTAKMITFKYINIELQKI